MTAGDTSRLVAAAVAGRSLAEMADAAGVSVSTVQRRLKDPDIASAIRDARTQQRQERLGQLNELSTRAVTRLSDLIDAPPGVALRAIGLVLNSVVKVDAVVGLEERLAALETAAAEERSGDDGE